MKKVLIFYTAIGQGHKSIAENIGASLLAAGFEVRLADAYQAQGGRLVRIGTVFHRFINARVPWLWTFLYTNKFFTEFSLRFRVKVASGNYQSMLAIIRDYNPGLVISTQAAPSGVVSYLKREKLFTGRFGIAFSDFHLHRYWLYDEAEFYLVNIKQQKREMAALGIAPEKIFVTGFNLKPQSTMNKLAIKRKFGVREGQKVILFGSGSLGLGFNKQLLRQLSRHSDWHTVIVCGTNEQIYRELRAEFKSPNISVCGFYSPMDELYAIADIFLTKPGGLSVTEALRWHLPMVITSMLPGQEEWNLRYLRQAVLVMPEESDILSQITRELATGDFKRTLLSNPRLAELFNCQTAAKVVQTILNVGRETVSSHLP